MMKNIEIDWDSVKEISMLRNRLRSRITELEKNSGAPTTRDLFQSKYDSITNIWNYDNSSIYDRVYDKSKDYYVYCHMNTNKPIILGKRSKKNPKLVFAASLGMNYVPFYIGKGKGNRYLNLNRNVNHKKVRDYLSSVDKETSIFVIKDNLSEKEAFIIEDKLIDIFGLNIFGGYLINIDEGFYPEHRRFLYKDDFININTFSKMKFKNFDGSSFLPSNVNSIE